MINQVSKDDILRIVGVPRHAVEHVVRAVVAEETVYILHSFECLRNTPDLRTCPYSIALDRGIENIEQMDVWRWVLDHPVMAVLRDGWLMPDPSAVSVAINASFRKGGE